MRLRLSIILTLVFAAFTASLRAQEPAAASPGIDLFNKGDYAGAVAALKNSKNYTELGYLGLAYEKLGDKKKAGKAFDKSFERGTDIIVAALTSNESDEKKPGISRLSTYEKLLKLAEPVAVTLSAGLKAKALGTDLGISYNLQMTGAFLAAVDALIKNGETIYPDDQLTTKLKILEKPLAYFTDDASRAHEEGTVEFLALFGADGKIYGFPLKTLRYGLTENAARALNGLTFEPATKDGKPVPVLKRVKYTFETY